MISLKISAHLTLTITMLSFIFYEMERLVITLPRAAQQGKLGAGWSPTPWSQVNALDLLNLFIEFTLSLWIPKPSSRFLSHGRRVESGEAGDVREQGRGVREPRLPVCDTFRSLLSADSVLKCFYYLEIW